MTIFKEIYLFVVILIGGFFYYKYSTSRDKFQKNMAFIIKMVFLCLSFILAFIQKDFIVIGGLALGGRTSVGILIMIEIVDAFVDKKKE